MTLRIGFLVSHPIQYYAPIFRELAKRCDLTVFFAHRQTAEQQASAGFGVAFEWDVDLLSGYHSRFLTNVARQPSTDRFCRLRHARHRGRRSLAAASTPSSCRAGRCGPTGRRCGPAGGRRARAGARRFPAARPAQRRCCAAPRRWSFRACCAASTATCMSASATANTSSTMARRRSRLFFSPHCVDNDAFRLAPMPRGSESRALRTQAESKSCLSAS